jgi:hypothetical protein
MRSTLSRRSFVTALASGCCLTPLLSSVSLRAQTAQLPPKRIIFLFNPNGTITDAFWPQAPQSETQFELGPILQPLQPFKERLLLLRGIDLAVTGKGPGGPHQRGMGGLLTGRTLQAGTMVGGDGSLAGWADGISVDQEIVKQLAPPTLLPSLELGVRATAPEVRSRLIYTGPGTAAPPLNDPAEVFQRLATGFSEGLDGPENEEARAQRRLVLSAVRQQYNALRPRISLADRERLERHNDVMAGIVRRLDFSVNDSPSCIEPIDPGIMDFDSEGAMQDVSKLQIDLMTLALSCDITRVASLQFSSAINAIRFPWLDSTAEGHSLSHRGPSDTQARDELIARSTWYAQRVAYLLERLASTPEGDGSLLDNTLVVWGNELSVGNTHNLSDIPFVMAGNLQGQLNTGRYLEFGGVPHNRLLVSVLQLMGIDTESFGDPDFTGDGGLTGLTV